MMVSLMVSLWKEVKNYGLSEAGGAINVANGTTPSGILQHSRDNLSIDLTIRGKLAADASVHTLLQLGRLHSRAACLMIFICLFSLPCKSILSSFVLVVSGSCSLSLRASTRLSLVC